MATKKLSLKKLWRMNLLLKKKHLKRKMKQLS